MAAMNGNPSKKIYYSFDPAKGYPAGAGLFYECLRCGEVVTSMPVVGIRCKCRNIMIDVDYGRIKIQDHGAVKLFSTEEQGRTIK